MSYYHTERLYPYKPANYNRGKDYNPYVTTKRGYDYWAWASHEKQEKPKIIIRTPYYWNESKKWPDRFNLYNVKGEFVDQILKTDLPNVTKQALHHLPKKYQYQPIRIFGKDRQGNPYHNAWTYGPNKKKSTHNWTLDQMHKNNQWTKNRIYKRVSKLMQETHQHPTYHQAQGWRRPENTYSYNWKYKK